MRPPLVRAVMGGSSSAWTVGFSSGSGNPAEQDRREGHSRTLAAETGLSLGRVDRQA